MIEEDEEKKQFNKEKGIRFLKFFVVGLVGWGINELLIFLGTLALDAITSKDPLFMLFSLQIDKILIASFISICIVMSFNFTINKIWTFRKKEEESQAKWYLQFIKFVLVSLSGLVIYLGFIYIFSTLLELNKYLSTSIGFFLGLVNNFIWNDLWTFKGKSEEKNQLNE